MKVTNLNSNPRFMKSGLGRVLSPRLAKMIPGMPVEIAELLFPLRSGLGPSEPARERARDGATARRCCIENNTSAARRLHYWVLADRSLELASVNVHEDATIPD